MASADGSAEYSVRVLVPRLTDAIRASLVAAECRITDVDMSKERISLRVTVRADTERDTRQRIARALAAGGTRVHRRDFTAASAESPAPALF